MGEANPVEGAGVDRSNSGRRILIVEDDAELLECYGDLLGSFGFETRMASDCEGAWQALQDGKVDVFMCDVYLRASAAFDLIKKAREKFPALTIVAISGRIADDYEADSIAAGANVFMPKPFLLSELITTLRGVESPR